MVCCAVVCSWLASMARPSHDYQRKPHIPGVRGALGVVFTYVCGVVTAWMWCGVLPQAAQRNSPVATCIS